jgi:hypothetical protein
LAGVRGENIEAARNAIATDDTATGAELNGIGDGDCGGDICVDGVCTSDCTNTDCAIRVATIIADCDISTYGIGLNFAVVAGMDDQSSSADCVIGTS